MAKWKNDDKKLGKINACLFVCTQTMTCMCLAFMKEALFLQSHHCCPDKGDELLDVTNQVIANF